MKKQFLQLLLLVSVASQAQDTLIPDANFEQRLIDLGIDIGSIDGKVETSRISGVTSLGVGNSNINSLQGIEDFVSLRRLDCNINKLTSLDLTKLVNLTLLQCDHNQITSLDLSKNRLLYFLQCNNNQLNNLNLKSGNNTELDLYSYYLDFKSNPSLTCIQVDDAEHSNIKWKDSKDPTAIYSENCSTLSIEETTFAKIVLSPNPSTGIIHIENIPLEKMTIYDAVGHKVSSMKFNKISNNTIDLSSLAKGIYYAYLESQGINIVREIILN
jgi:hypothetical protein